MSKKGMSLPINLIVVLSIAILVMVVVAAMFVLYTGQAGSTLSDSDAWARGCQIVRQRGCLVADFNTAGATPSAYVITGYRPSGGTVDETIVKACKRFFNDNNLVDGDCRTKCCG